MIKFCYNCKKDHDLEELCVYKDNRHYACEEAGAPFCQCQKRTNMKQRQIKFRAWDEEKRKMYHFEGVGYCSEYNELTFSCKGVDVLYERGCDNQIKLMQFTGLLDKNGKEIYEGDFLKHDLWGIDEVIWDNEGACFRGRSEEHDITLAHHQLQRSRVISNIYELKHQPDCQWNKEYPLHEKCCCTCKY